MEEHYEILLDDYPAGRIQLLRQGLYAKCFCSCKGDGNLIYRIVACWDDGWENLGILVPEGESLVLRKNIPAKRLSQENLTFRMVPFDQDIEEFLRKTAEADDFNSDTSPEQQEENSVPEQDALPDLKEHKTEDASTADLAKENKEEQIFIDPDVSFDHLESLDHARFALVDGKPTAIIASPESQISSDNPTGQWSDPYTSE